MPDLHLRDTEIAPRTDLRLVNSAVPDRAGGVNTRSVTAVMPVPEAVVTRTRVMSRLLAASVPVPISSTARAIRTGRDVTSSPLALSARTSRTAEVHRFIFSRLVTPVAGVIGDVLLPRAVVAVMRAVTHVRSRLRS